MNFWAKKKKVDKVFNNINKFDAHDLYCGIIESNSIRLILVLGVHLCLWDL